MRKRVKCLTNFNPTTQKYDPSINKGLFYNVIEEEIHVIGNDPFIKVNSKKFGDLERPRSMFGQIIKD